MSGSGIQNCTKATGMRSILFSLLFNWFFIKLNVAILLNQLEKLLIVNISVLDGLSSLNDFEVIVSTNIHERIYTVIPLLGHLKVFESGDFYL